MSADLERSLIITAAGSGSRMGTQIPKQFLEIGEKPILVWTIEKFRSVFQEIEIVVVLSQEGLNIWNSICNEFDLDEIKTVIGGNERFDSVKKGLAECSGDLIAVHDAVRPFVSHKVIQETFEKAEVVGAAVPVTLPKSSLRRFTSDDSEAVDRNNYRLVQTPQVFKATIIKMAYEQSFDSKFTDDASVVESAGQDIVLVDGNDENIKITTPLDLKLAEIILSEENSI